MTNVEGRISKRHDWADGLMTLTLDAAVEPFVPGQFLNLGLRIGAETLFRAYSLASAPGSSIEFFLSEVPDGSFSPALFRLQPGDPVLIDPKPHGFFTLQWVPAAEELWLIATGTGLAPFISMLRSGEPLRRFSRVVVIHGARVREHLAYADELRELSRQSAGALTWVPVLSRELTPGVGVPGRVTSTLEDGSLERAVGVPLSPERAHVMLCGNPSMIDEMLVLLEARGMRRHRARRPGHVTVEKYWE